MRQLPVVQPWYTVHISNSSSGSGFYAGHVTVSTDDHDELIPLQKRIEELNNRLGVEVIRLKHYNLGIHS
jgi:hypothetical protein